ncbi:MAG: flagellar filament capping protein FliD [Nitrospira sp.]|uniref:Flagellar hook-associated protein 2 n=1 Tax=Nitrospira defluvii TaxID=330214 RepID=A0ABN7M2P1_9BACT|nr:flagellar filament capping protein FliD [Nitrospira defluvii]MCS6329553.1 flagellar filament capping protein FliD [Nitrospira sp.]CAE6776568.1 Flagellar hook-associated protein 2 [Nitrospira defluvii]
MAISFGGLGNGVDFGQVVTELAKVQRLPIDALTAKKKDLQTKLTDYGTLGNKLLALQSAANALRLSSSFDRTTTTVSDDTVLTAQAGAGAATGSYSIQVSQLAKANQITNKAAKAVAGTTSAIVSGGTGTFTFRVGSGSNQTVTLADGATLDDLRFAINDLGAGVTASVINTGTTASPAYRLTLTATASGAANTVSVLTDTTSLDFTNTSGTGGSDTLQAGQNAIVVIGDPSETTISIERESNVISDAIPDVTLTLKSKTVTTPTPEPVTVNITTDPNSVKTNIKALATAYNDVVKFVNERTTYDITTKTGGIFFNEATAKSVLSQLRTAISGEVPELSTYKTLGAVGFKTERDGTITIDDAKLDTALASNYSATKALFITQTTSSGVADRMVKAVDFLDSVDTGSFTIRKNSITSQISRLTAEIGRKEDLAAQYEERLRIQFASLDGLLQKLQGQSTALQALQ